MINKYNKIIEEIVKEFAIRYYKECFNERKYKDYRLIDYQGIKNWPLDICDEFYSINDILITIKYNIPLKIVREWYNKSLEVNYKWETMENLYNFFRKTCYKESLKKSEENVKKAKEELEKIIKGSK